MTDYELSKLSRKELLEILLKLSMENQSLQERLKQAETALQDRQIKLDSAGSIAEASLLLSGVFEVAQEACRQYTESIETLSQRQEAICAQREQESRATAEALVESAKQQSETLLRTTEAECAEMVQRAKKESEDYWSDVAEKLERFYTEHVGLREMLSIMTKPQTQEQETKL